MEGGPHMGRTSPHLLTSTDPQLARPAGGSDSHSGHLPGLSVSVVTQGESLDSRIAVESRAGASPAEPAGPARRLARRAAGPAAAEVAAATGETAARRRLGATDITSWSQISAPSGDRSTVIPPTGVGKASQCSNLQALTVFNLAEALVRV